ncbi:hypothetical protein DXG01_008105, partial [Tephrocybe rancida]
ERQVRDYGTMDLWDKEALAMVVEERNMINEVEMELERAKVGKKCVDASTNHPSQSCHHCSTEGQQRT